MASPALGMAFIFQTEKQKQTFLNILTPFRMLFLYSIVQNLITWLYLIIMDATKCKLCLFVCFNLGTLLSPIK